MEEGRGILCGRHTLHMSRSGKWNNMLSKSLCQERRNIWYETHQTTVDLMEGCSSKLDHMDSAICGMLSVKETVENRVSSACLSVACFDLKTDHTHKTLLNT
jgi:hypothetical protein